MVVEVHHPLVVSGGGTDILAGKNTIDYVQIMTFGNAVDFGDLNYQNMVVVLLQMVTEV